LSNGFDLTTDATFSTWRMLKMESSAASNVTMELIDNNNNDSAVNVSDTSILQSLGDVIDDTSVITADELLTISLESINQQDDSMPDQLTENEIQLVAHKIAHDSAAGNRVEPAEFETTTEAASINSENANKPITGTLLSSCPSTTPPAKFPFKNRSYPGDGDEDILPYPVTSSHKKTARKGAQMKYFVLTSKEAHAAKVKYQDDKMKKEKEKQDRKRMHELKSLQKQQEKTEKAALAEKRKAKNKKKK